MANDWFMFRRPAGSIAGTSCIFFVQVVFVGIGSPERDLGWRCEGQRWPRQKGSPMFGDHDVSRNRTCLLFLGRGGRGVRRDQQIFRIEPKRQRIPVDLIRIVRCRLSRRRATSASRRGVPDPGGSSRRTDQGLHGLPKNARPVRAKQLRPHNEALQRRQVRNAGRLSLPTSSDGKNPAPCSRAAFDHAYEKVPDQRDRHGVVRFHISEPGGHQPGIEHFDRAGRHRQTRCCHRHGRYATAYTNPSRRPLASIPLAIT